MPYIIKRLNKKAEVLPFTTPYFILPNDNGNLHSAIMLNSNNETMNMYKASFNPDFSNYLTTKKYKIEPSRTITQSGAVRSFDDLYSSIAAKSILVNDTIPNENHRYASSINNIGYSQTSNSATPSFEAIHKDDISKVRSLYLGTSIYIFKNDAIDFPNLRFLSLNKFTNNYDLFKIVTPMNSKGDLRIDLHVPSIMDYGIGKTQLNLEILEILAQFDNSTQYRTILDDVPFFDLLNKNSLKVLNIDYNAHNLTTIFASTVIEGYRQDFTKYPNLKIYFNSCLTLLNNFNITTMNYLEGLTLHIYSDDKTATENFIKRLISNCPRLTDLYFCIYTSDDNLYYYEYADLLSTIKNSYSSININYSFKKYSM